MKKKSLAIMAVVLLSGAMMMQSCIGSFGLTNKLLSWNKSVGSKFANEVVFFAFWVLPVYEITLLADVVVLNSIEFWGGDNPVASNGKTLKIKGENGDNFVIKQTKGGYKITNKDKKATVALNFDASQQTWSAEADGQSYKLMTFIDADNVRMYLPDGQTMNVELSQSGMLAMKEILQGNAALMTAR